MRARFGADEGWGRILLNTARGGLLDEQAVADALRSGKLLAAGMDVVSAEPIRADNPLLTAPRLLPHAAYRVGSARNAPPPADHQRGKPARLPGRQAAECCESVNLQGKSRGMWKMNTEE